MRYYYVNIKGVRIKTSVSTHAAILRTIVVACVENEQYALKIWKFF